MMQNVKYIATSSNEGSSKNQSETEINGIIQE
jgi:hypothetical protein